MKVKFLVIILAHLVVLPLLYLLSGGLSSKESRLIIFHAGSLSLPIKAVVEEFNKLNPEISILTEAAGSLDTARKITDLKKDCDIMLSADYKVIDKMLIPEYAAWNIKFASNEMSIAYRDSSRRADEIDKDNWHEILLDEKVSFGRSDPNADPCGYRSILTMKLAELYYKQPGLAEKLIAKDNQFIRSKETDLIALLESGALDYIFLYRSCSEQHKLRYLVLPGEMNLGDPKHVELYSGVSVDLRGSGDVQTIQMRGEPMVYGMTVLKNAKNMDAANKFAEFFLGEAGSAILKEMGQPSVIPTSATGYEKIPENLKRFARED